MPLSCGGTWATAQFAAPPLKSGSDNQCDSCTSIVPSHDDAMTSLAAAVGLSSDVRTAGNE